MALQYGMNITASDMRSLLEKNDKQQSGVRTWRQLFGGASLGANAQSDALATDYSGAIAQAYASNLRQNDAILGAGLNAGATRDLLSTSRNDLHAAYETYVHNYGKDLATATSAYGEEVGAINTALTERAANFSNLYNSAYDYLAKELYQATQMVPGNAQNGATPIYENNQLTGYEPVEVDYFKEHGLDWLLDENGQLMSWDRASTTLFNRDGSLTREGVKFFDQMFNTPPEEYRNINGDALMSFDEWLGTQKGTFANYDEKTLPGMAKNGEALREWWAGEDAFNYNFAGTNRGTAQSLAGRESTDDMFGVYEYATKHGMSEFAQTDFGESGELFQNALKKYQSYESAVEAYESSMKPGISADPFGGLLDSHQKAAARNNTNAEAKNAWTGYQVTAEELGDKLDDFFKHKVGSAKFDEFKSANAKLYSEYDQLLKRARESQYADATIAKELDSLYNRLLKQMNKYIEEYGYTDKTSGF